jgi:hypothetical protein
MTRSAADELIDLFAKNLVAVVFTNPRADVYGMKLQLMEPGKYQLSAGNEFNAYWCPYAEDTVNAVTLSDEADLMFTATMNGCSFGVGIPSVDGAVRVAHANTTTHEKLEALSLEMVSKLKPNTTKENRAFNNAVIGANGTKQGAMKQSLQLEQLKALLAETGDTLSNHISRAAYNGCTSITTFGLRVGSVWEFWFQGNINAEVCGCFPFPKVNPR